MSDERTISSEDAQRRLAEINLQTKALYEESKALKTLLVSRTPQKFSSNQVLQWLNDQGQHRNVLVLDAFPSQRGWVYKCKQAAQLYGYKTIHIAEHLLHDIDLTGDDLLKTSPKHEDHNKKIKVKKGAEESIVIPKELQDQIDALL